MRFDAPPNTQEAVRRILGPDPRVLRYGVVKLGRGTLADGAKYGEVRWTRKEGLVQHENQKALFDSV